MKHLSLHSLSLPLIPFLSLILASPFLFSCAGNDSKNDTTNADSLPDIIVDARQDSIRHTPDYIAQRIDTFYKYKDDMRFCSAHYLLLDAQAGKLSHELGYVYRDYDHWIAGQDIDPKWSYKTKAIKDIKEATATVEMTIHNFSNRRIILNLVYERGDWFVDDFRTSFSGKKDLSEVSEKSDMLTFIYDCSHQKLDEKYGPTFDIHKYLDDMKSVANPMVVVEEDGSTIVYDQYALIDIDLDGKPEVWVKSTDQYYDAVFSISGDKVEMLAEGNGHTVLAFFENGVGSQGSCGTGCAHAEYCILKDSRPACRTSWIDQYNMNNERMESESGYTVNGKECSEEEYQKVQSEIGEYVTFNPIWHPINNTKKLSDYAE